MCIKYLIFCLVVATITAEPPPVFMDLPTNAHPANKLVYQQLPQEHNLRDFLPPPITYGAPAAQPNANIVSAESAIPLQDSYNAAFLRSSSQQHQTGYDQGPTETQVHKHIYVHIPPADFEQEDDIQPRLIHQTGAKQKHYKIIFIKAPAAPSVRTPIVPPLPQSEEKTLIYVLHQKPETHPNVIIPAVEPTKPSKPEVYFIKYKNKRLEAPVYGPPPALREIQSRQADESNTIAGGDFMPSNNQQKQVESSTVQLPHDTGADQQKAQAKLVTEMPPSDLATDFYNSPTESNSINEEIQASTTVESRNMYLPPESTLSPIIVKAMEESHRLPAATYGAPKRNRFFIKRRK